ncbi:flagellar hook-associated protein FlgL [Bacillus dakarensis]|uniref:flagellar hook-associated protein FlgL n=1 Tax=Robertmurraya dakarensis TaxID=1926278 RepID=UPI0009824916|nr:flagellar hook-associated protein FlgL [Bacillus dakarensis]
MRVTQGMLARNNLSYISNNYKQYSEILDQINSGKKITRPSQDPVVAIKGMAYRSQVTETEQFQRNLNEVTSWMDNTDAALDETTQVLMRIKELTIQASNETYTSSQRQGIAEEVKQLQGHLETLGNTLVNNKFIFNGTNISQKPIDIKDIKKSISDFISSDASNGSEFHIRYESNLYTFEYESKDDYVFKNGDIELAINKKRSDITLSTGESVSPEKIVMSNKNLSDIDPGKENEFAVYYEGELYKAYEESGEVIYKNGDGGQLTIDRTSTLPLMKDGAGTEVEESNLSIITTTDLSSITQGKGSEYILHFQDEQYVFDREQDGQFVFKNGNKQITVDNDSEPLTVTYTPGSPDDPPVPDDLIGNIVVSRVIFSDLIPSGRSEFVISYQNKQYSFDRADEFGGNEFFVFKNGDQELKIEFDSNKQPTITLDENLDESKTLEQADIVISPKDAISSNEQDFEIEVMKGINISVNIRPQNVFPSQLFKDISDLAKVLEVPSNSGSDVNAFLSKIEGHIDNVVNERSDLGARYNRVELIADRLSRQDVIAKQTLSENEDVDFEEVITNLKIQEMIQQAALAVGARIIQPTLMDFLR